MWFDCVKGAPPPVHPGNRAELNKEMHGLADLTPENRKAVLDEVTSKTAVALEEVDPNDPAFTKPEGPVPRLPTPPALTRPLLSFQEEGLGWMVANEVGRWCEL